MSINHQYDILKNWSPTNSEIHGMTPEELTKLNPTCKWVGAKWQNQDRPIATNLKNLFWYDSQIFGSRYHNKTTPLYEVGLTLSRIMYCLP